MTVAPKCPRCGAALDAAASLQGLCPRCLMQRGMRSSAPAETKTGGASDSGPDLPASIQHPTRIGFYRVLGVLGEGGMGIVYLAEQEQPVRRRVAIKLIKLGMDTSQVLARFESERQALAILNHPGIAKVHDAGMTEEGRPYFVMEQVAGIPITDYCDRNRLGVHARLELFVQVCQAIHHAHQKGIIHRDVKPSNILVALEDGKPVTKVIDFGVAKAIDRQLTERTLFTEHGFLIGTPEYMSPEQADPSPLDIDTATDVYSLGVLLYELLVGVLPFDSTRLREAGDHEMRRIIREDDPPRPSDRVSASDADRREDTTLARAAESRRSDPGTLRRQIRGDLDWITMRAIEKDRTRRYASASELGADVGRFLKDEPVLAGPPSALYRLKKLIRRNRGSMAAAAAILVLLIVGLAVSSALFVRSERARREAIRQNYVANLFSADASLRTGEMREAKRRLLACDPALRNWEWRHLYGRTDTSLATIDADGSSDWAQIFKDVDEARSVTWSFQVGPAESASWSADGSRILWLARDSLRQADARTFRPIESPSDRPRTAVPWKDQPGWMLSSTLAYSPDGAHVLWRTSLPHPRPDGVDFREIDRDYSLYVQDATTGGFTASLSGLGSDAVSAVFSPDGKKIATGGADGTITVWDAASGDAIRKIQAHENPVWALALSSDGTLVASGSGEDTLRIWFVETGEIQSVYGLHDASVTALAFDPRGKWISAAFSDGAVHVWTIIPGLEMPVVLRGHEGAARAVAFSHDGTRIATGGSDKTVRIWETTSGALLGLHRGHDDGVNAVAFSVDGKRIVSSSEDNTIRVWDARPGAPGLMAVRSLSGHEGWVQSVAFGPDGSRLVSGGWEDHSVRVWDAVSGRELAKLETPDESKVVSVAFSPDGSWIAAAGMGMPVVLWDASSYEELRRFSVGTLEDLIFALAPSPDGSRLACTLADKTIAIVDARTGAALSTLPRQAEHSFSVAFSPDGRLLAAGYEDGTVRVWDAESTRLLAEWSGHRDSVISVTFTADGRRLVSTAAEGTLRVWDATTGKPVAELYGHDAKVASVALSPDGSRIVGGSGDGTLRIWDASTFDPLLTLRGHENFVRSVAFSPDGTRIASASYDGTVRIWYAKSRAPAR